MQSSSSITMSRSTLSFFILVLLLVLPSNTESRLVSNTNGGKSHSATSLSANPTASPEASTVDNEDCSGLGIEECLIRKSIVAHTDYIYTQDVNGP